MAVSHPPDALGRLFCPRRTVSDREEGAGKAPACGTKMRMARARLSFLTMADSREVRTRGRTCAEFGRGLQTSISRYPHDLKFVDANVVPLDCNRAAARGCLGHDRA